MSESVKKLSLKQKYQALQMKHRIMTLVLIALLLLVLFDLFWFQAELKKQEQLSRQFKIAEKEREELLATNQQRQQQLAGVAFNEKRKQISSFQKQIKGIDESLAQYANLVSAKEMPQLLKSFFEKSSRLKFKGLTKHPVKEAFEKKDQKSIGASVEAERATLYRHEFTVTLHGQFFDLMKSLKDLEAINIKIYWDSLKYHVDSFPNADINITVYTFSYDKNWIGA